jgi:hypothetical protein
MNLLKFIIGVLGVLLIIGAFSYFFPLFLVGGIATGNVAFAFGLPIFLIVIGAVMVYFGFFNVKSESKNGQQLWKIAKWGALYTLAVLLGNYIISRFMIADTLITILLTALVVSIVAQIVISHNSNFRLKWFIFYFLVYAIVIWSIGEFIIPKVAFQAGFFSALLIGFVISGVVSIIQKLNIRGDSVHWISIVLAMILLVANLDSIQLLPITSVLDISSNYSNLSEDKQVCPDSISSVPPIQTEAKFDSVSLTGQTLNALLNRGVWKIEGNIRHCYKGKYKGQYPDWFYCDDMIVSRWETGSSGTIKYRWYTAVTSNWRPVKGDSFETQYVFNGFSCENGQKVTVDKEKTSYYVYVSRDGTEIKVQY